jgi:hypothetical protein
VAVLIIFGSRRLRKQLGMVMMLCSRCQRPSAHGIVRVHTWFTLFFIPVLPLAAKYSIICPMCGGATKIDKAHALHLEAAAAAQSAPPVEMTPDGPLTAYQPVVIPPGSAPVVAAGQGSGAPQGPNWWQATDGKWYPPQMHPESNPN